VNNMVKSYTEVIEDTPAEQNNSISVGYPKKTKQVVVLQQV
jgi:hypothetical protein